MTPKKNAGKIMFAICANLIILSCAAQLAVVKQINGINSPSVALEPLRFLASDELMGRGTTRPEINIAARYISEQFRSLRVKQCEGTTDYFQTFDIKMATPSSAGALKVNTTTYTLGTDLLQLRGEDVSLDAPIVYAGYGTRSELGKIDVKGKIVVTNMGSSDSSSFMDGFGLFDSKRKLVLELGGIALIERFKEDKDIPWDLVKQYLMSEHPSQQEDIDLSAFIVKDNKDVNLASLLQNQGVKATLVVTGNQLRNISAKNVIGFIQGTDPKLKDQFVVLSAHYDHLGIAKQPKMEEGKMDSIYNGARDNAIGSAAVIDAARYFTQHPPKRSILFIVYTAEEIGLVGSNYFAEHPTIPLSQLVYNLNIDNASYNDTTIVTLIGLGRTSADADIKNACIAYGLKASADPAPEQGLFDRSDNVSLAVKGIPAPTFSLGIKKFDETITNRYHQLSDEVGNFNLTYAMKYINSFILAAKYIADNTVQPKWIKGDKYEGAWKQLYRKQ